MRIRTGRLHSTGAAAVLAAVLLAAGTATAGADEATQTLGAVTGSRAAAHLAAYTVAADLTAVAGRHARRLAAERRLYHNPNLATEVGRWLAVGENVGYGADARQVHDAFLRSTEHRANILDRDFTQIGVGAARSADGVLYVVEVFRQPELRAAPSRTRLRQSPRTPRGPRRSPPKTPVAQVRRPRPQPGDARHHLSWAELIHALHNLLDRLDGVSP